MIATSNCLNINRSLHDGIYLIISFFIHYRYYCDRQIIIILILTPKELCWVCVWSPVNSSTVRLRVVLKEETIASSDGAVASAGVI